MPLFIIIVTLVIVLNIRLRYLSKNYDMEYDRQRYLSREREASFSRAKELDEHMIIKLSEKELPFRFHYDKDIPLENELIRIQDKVRLNLELPVIKTDLATNTEVKRRFGAANLQAVIDGEENFTRLIRHLNKWAGLLLEAGSAKDAETVLDAAVSCRSDVSQTYILLYDIYERSGRQGEIEELKGHIDGLPEIAKNKVLKYIEGRRPR